MGGFFGVVSKSDAMPDVFFGTDYHSHLGTKSAGMAAYDKDLGLQRVIHNIENAPFRTKFEHIFEEMRGTSAIGGINDTDPQPLLIRSRLGTFAICMVGVINNIEDILDKYLIQNGGHFDAMSGGRVNSTELVGALIGMQKSYTEGIRFAQQVTEGTVSLLLLKDDGSMLAARDKYGRLPVVIGQNENGYCAAFESFAFVKLGYEPVKELGPGEIVEMTPESIEVLQPAGEEMRICSFLWTYYGYPTSTYEGVNVEAMRYCNGASMAKNDMESGNMPELDYACGVPDSGTPHAIGFSNCCHVPFARPFIKYTPTWPRSFMPPNQKERNRVAKMKQIPVEELIKDKKLLFVDDSIVRGTQLRETVEFLYQNGAKAVHMRSACPPIMYGCKYLNFSRATNDMELITRSTIVELEGEAGLEHIDEYSDPTTERGKAMRSAIAAKFHFESLEFQTLEDLVASIGIEPCKLCTYCWNGKE